MPQAATLPPVGRAAPGGRRCRLASRLLGVVLLAAALAAGGLLAAWSGVAEAQTLVGSVQVGEVPIFVRVSPDGRQAIVLNFFSTMNNIMVIDLASLRVVQNFSVGMRPQFADFAPNGQAIVGFDEALEVTFLDINAGSVIQNVPVGNRPTFVRVDPSGGRALVANGVAGTLTVIDLTTRQAVGTIEVGRNPRFITYTPDGRIAVVANGRSNDVSVVDVAAGQQLASVAVGSNPTAVQLLPDLSRALVTNAGDHTVMSIDVATLEPTTIPVQCQPSDLAVNPQGTLAFIANSDSDTVSILSLTTNQIIRTFEAGDQPQSLSLTPDGRRLLVANQLASQVRVFDVSAIDPNQAPAPTDFNLATCGAARPPGEVDFPPPPDLSGLPPTLFVDASAEAGGDGSQERPFRSITAALNASSQGEVIFVASGTYSPSLTGETIPIGVPTDELPQGPPEDVALIGAGAETTVIDTEEATRFGNGNAIQVFNSGMRIEGFTIENAKGAGIFIAGEGRLANVRVANNLVRFSAVHGIGAQDVDGCVIANNVTVMNDTNGIAISNSDCTITGNTANQNDLDGILVGNGGIVTIENNIMLSNGSSGLEANNRPLDPSSPPRAMVVRVIGNTVSSNGGRQFATAGAGINITEGARAELVAHNTTEDNVTGGITVFENGRADLITNNTSSNNRGEGIRITVRSTVGVISNNVTNNNELNGIGLDGDARVGVIRDNLTSGNKQSGIAVLVRSGADSIAGNTITNNLINGIFVFQASVVTATDNLVQTNGNSGIAADSNSTVRATGNTITGHPNSAALAATNGSVIIAGANTLSGNALPTFGSVQSGLALPTISISPGRISTSEALDLTLTTSIPSSRSTVTRDTVLKDGVDIGLALLPLMFFDASGQSGTASFQGVSFTAANNATLTWIVETASGTVSAALIIEIP